MLAAVGGLDLDRGVVDAPLLANKSLGTAQDLDEVDLVFDFNVDRQRGLAHRERPHVQVVHRDDAGQLAQVIVEQLGVHVTRRALHDHVQGIFQDAYCRVQHENGKDEGADGVGNLVVGLLETVHSSNKKCEREWERERETIHSPR